MLILVTNLHLQCFNTLGWPTTNFSDEMLAWLSVWSEVHMTCIWSADATATPSSLLHKNPEWFIFLEPAYPGCPGKRLLNDCCCCCYY